MTGMSGAMPGASTSAKSILCPTVLGAISAGAASGNDAPTGSALAVSVLAVSVLAVSVLARSVLAASTPASAILGVALNSLVNGIAASPDGDRVSGMNSCLLIGGSSM